MKLTLIILFMRVFHCEGIMEIEKQYSIFPCFDPSRTSTCSYLLWSTDLDWRGMSVVAPYRRRIHLKYLLATHLLRAARSFLSPLPSLLSPPLPSPLPCPLLSVSGWFSIISVHCCQPDVCFLVWWCDRGLWLRLQMSVVMWSISRSTGDCNGTTFQPQRSSSGTKPSGLNWAQLSVLYLMKTFMVETLYHCNLLCYVKCSTSLLTFLGMFDDMAGFWLSSILICNN